MLFLIKKTGRKKKRASFFLKVASIFSKRASIFSKRASFLEHTRHEGSEKTVFRLFFITIVR